MTLFKLCRYIKALLCYLVIHIFDPRGVNKYMSKWYEVLPINYNNELRNFCYYFTYFKEFRSVLYWQLGGFGAELLKLLAPPHPTLYIDTPKEKVQNGLILQHGHSTIIYAESIGENCQIWQNVTIGKQKSGGIKPKIGNNVKIYAGAIVVGDITIGDNVQIGANSVVCKSVPDNCVVAGNPAKIIRQNGLRINKFLT